MSDSSELELSNQWKIWVPKKVKPTILSPGHDDNTAGHLSIAKTTARLILKYYWPGKFTDIAAYVSNVLVRLKLSRMRTNQGKYHNLRRREWCHVGETVMKMEHVLSSAVKEVAFKYSSQVKLTFCWNIKQVFMFIGKCTWTFFI